MNTNTTLRLFVAVPVPEKVRRNYAEILNHSACKTRRGISWVRPENLHFTLDFLGSTSADLIPALTAAIVRSAPLPFELELQKYGFFPTPDRPRVFWAGVSRGGREMTAWAQSLCSFIDPILGRDAKRPPFKPHLTLARIKDRQIQGPDMLKSFGEKNLGAFIADRAILFQSRLDPRGVKYTNLFEHHLKNQ
jgi:2'-5' RNA ligase